MTGLLPLPGGKTVTLVRRTVSGRDAYGNDVYADTSTAVAGCVVYRRASTELVQGQDLAIDGLTVLFPPGTTVLVTDRVTVDGQLYEVDGPPSLWSNAFLGRDECVQADLTRYTG